jgi:hypothetical protein
MSITHVYAGNIVKTETTADGDLLVYGKATGPDLDLDEQRCDPDWLKSAMPGWAQWANIREQHSAIAAGVGIETVQDGDDWYVKSLVVDAGSRAKVEKGVLKGYSIGIKNARVVKDAAAPGGRIVSGEIVEISLVDRPCNPTATMAIAKSADGELAPVDVAGELVMDLSKAVIIDAPDQTGAAKAAPAFDRNAAVALVADVLAGGRGPVELNKAATGYDESADIAGALAVIRDIAELIRSEAQSLGEGRLEEVWDIGCLMDAVRSMSYFLMCEREQDNGVGDAADEVTYVGLAADAEAKTADGADATKSATIEQAFEKSAARVTLVKALDASKERIAALEADLAKAEAQPAAGGPAIMRVPSVSQQAPKTAGPDAAHYRRMAEEVQDSQARRGYLQLAKQAAADNAEDQ